MDAGGQQVGKRPVDHPLPPNARLAEKAIRDDIDRKMALAGAVVAHMAGMVVAVVGHDQMGRGQGVVEPPGDQIGERQGGGVGHRAYIAPFAKGSRVAREKISKDRPNARFHGRVEANGRPCEVPGCAEAGEFRAPPVEGAPQGGERPNAYRWFCLEHIRAFNAGYNYFAGMTAEEITDAQRPYAGWDRETRAFARAGVDPGPAWADFADPLDAIGAKFRDARVNRAERRDGRSLSPADRSALKVMGLDIDVDRTGLRQRYSELVRRYHPDRNGGDRQHEAALQKVIAAYQQLKGAAAFA